MGAVASLAPGFSLRSNARVSLVRFVGSGFGLGLLPKAPGTWGTLLGVALGWAAFRTSDPNMTLIIGMFVVSLGSVPLARAAEREAAGTDPGWFVLDEVAGYLVVLIGLPLLGGSLWVTLAAAFVAFRVFDISKPPPIKTLEKLPGGWGVVVDDLMAGVYGHILLRLVAALL